LPTNKLNSIFKFVNDRNLLLNVYLDYEYPACILAHPSSFSLLILTHQYFFIYRIYAIDKPELRHFADHYAEYIPPSSSSPLPSSHFISSPLPLRLLSPIPLHLLSLPFYLLFTSHHQVDRGSFQVCPFLRISPSLRATQIDHRHRKRTAVRFPFSSCKN
jgi:hypothetical protein